MLNKKIKKIINIFLIFGLIFSLTSCRPVRLPNPVVKVPEWSLGMVMIVVAEEKNTYEKVFGKRIWSLKNGNTDFTYEQYILSSIKQYIEKLMTINLMINDDTIQPNNDEKEIIKKLSREYFDLLNEGDLKYIKCNLEDVENLYTEYLKASKIAKIINQGANSDISVSETKVIEIEQIKLNDLEKAKDIWQKVNTKGVSFTYYAKQYSIEYETVFEIDRNSSIAVTFPELFYLNTGEISEILIDDNNYYIFKCINGYKEQETLKRRKNIINAIKQKAFDEQYDKFQAEHKVYLRETYWNDIKLSSDDNCTISAFWNLFDKYFGDKL